MLAPIIRAVDSALLLGPRGATQGANEHDVRVFWVNEYASDPSRVIESSVSPCLTGIERDIRTIAHDIAVADCPRFPSPHPYHAWIVRSDCNRYTRGGLLVFKHCLP